MTRRRVIAAAAVEGERQMAILNIITYPDPVLRAETKPVTDFDEKLKRLIADMWETMYFANGVGLAAPQVGVPAKLIVLDWEGNKYVLVNPEIVEEEGEEICSEGCLSFPDVYEDVARPSGIRVRYQDETGSERDERIGGFLARVFAHEIDHLHARLLIDHLSPLKRAFLKKKMERRMKASA